MVISNSRYGKNTVKFSHLTIKKAKQTCLSSHINLILSRFKEYDLHTPIHNGNCCMAMEFYQ